MPSKHCHCRKRRKCKKKKNNGSIANLSVTNNESGEQLDTVTSVPKKVILNFNTDNQNVPIEGFSRIGITGTHFRCLVAGLYRVHYTAAYALSDITEDSLVQTSTCIVLNGALALQSKTVNKDWVLSSNPVSQSHTLQKGILMNFAAGDVINLEFEYFRSPTALELPLTMTTSLQTEQHLDLNLIQEPLF
uniref:Uncharacterized protein n=1 Tax=Pithovirus LCPAC404 TaxID=2506597 RepID=A0A481ZCN2_9VIRU|nr:MAG: uncharacterized protein LCPAC404_02410 [Pithovirus LCPAC404]